MSDKPASQTAFDQARAAFSAGLACHQAGDFSQAVLHYQASLRLLPGRPSTLTNLAASQLQLGQPAAALASADAALAAEPDSADALLHRATALAQLGRAEQALAEFERLTTLAPGHPLAWSHRGNLLRELQRYDEATSVLREAMRLGADAELHRWYLAGLGDGSPPPAPPRRYVERLFDGYADDFDAHLLGPLGYCAHHELVARVRRCADGSQPFRSVLDLGCGTGLCGPLLRPLLQAPDGRLTGIDLSAAMLGHARACGAYHRLEQADAVQFLATSAEPFDLVMAADVLIYLGDPAPLFAAAARAMRHGLLAFTAEATPDADAGGPAAGWQLLPSLRYAHARAHLLQLALAFGFEPLLAELAPVRSDQGRPVDGLYLVLRRAAGDPPGLGSAAA